MQFSSLIVLVALLLVHSHVAHATGSFKCHKLYSPACIRVAVPGDAHNFGIGHAGLPGKVRIVTPARGSREVKGMYSCAKRSSQDLLYASTTPFCCHELRGLSAGERLAISLEELELMRCSAP